MNKFITNLVLTLALIFVPVMATAQENTCLTTNDLVEEIEKQNHKAIILEDTALELFDEAIQEMGGPPKPDNIKAIGMIDPFESRDRNPFIVLALFGEDGCYLGLTKFPKRPTMAALSFVKKSLKEANASE